MHMTLAAVVNTTAKTVQNVAILCMNSLPELRTFAENKASLYYWSCTWK